MGNIYIKEVDDITPRRTRFELRKEHWKDELEKERLRMEKERLENCLELSTRIGKISRYLSQNTLENLKREINEIKPIETSRDEYWNDIWYGILEETLEIFEAQVENCEKEKLDTFVVRDEIYRKKLETDESRKEKKDATIHPSNLQPTHWSVYRIFQGARNLVVPERRPVDFDAIYMNSKKEPTFDSSTDTTREISADIETVNLPRQEDV